MLRLIHAAESCLDGAVVEVTVLRAPLVAHNLDRLGAYGVGPGEGSNSFGATKVVAN